MNIHRTHGQSYANFADPISADRNGALRNFCALAMTLPFVVFPAFIYALEATVDASSYVDANRPVSYAIHIQSTADMGDINIPKSYRVWNLEK